MTKRTDVEIECQVKRAKGILGDKIHDVDVEYMVRQAYELTRPRTEEERAEIERKMDADFKEFMARQRVANRLYAKRMVAKIQQRHRPKRFFGIKIGWWY